MSESPATKLVEIEVDVEHATLTETWRLRVPAELENEALHDYCSEHLEDAEFVSDKSDNEEGRSVTSMEVIEDEQIVSEPSDLSDLPEGLNAYVSSTEMIVRDAQDWVWVTVHEGHPGDPSKWGAALRRRILTAIGLPYSAKEPT